MKKFIKRILKSILKKLTIVINEDLSQNTSKINETNKKKLEIINNLDQETINRLEGSSYNFYTIMKHCYAMYSKKELANTMENDIKKHKLNIINGGGKLVTE